MHTSPVNITGTAAVFAAGVLYNGIAVCYWLLFGHDDKVNDDDTNLICTKKFSNSIKDELKKQLNRLLKQVK